jgi:hypothetical protein
MLRLSLISTLFILFFSFYSSAQTSNCVKGDFIKNIGKYEELIEVENKLCAEIKDNIDLQEVYGFVINAKFAKVIRIFKDKAVFTYYEDYVRYKERNLTDKEIETLRNKLNQAKPEALPSIRDYKRCTDMCLHYEFLKVALNGGQRVSIFSQRYRPPEPINKLADFFNEIAESGYFRHYYYIQNRIKNFELLLADNFFSVVAVWKKGNDFRVLVQDDSKWQKNFEAAIKYFEDSTPTSRSESYEQRLKRLKRRSQIENAHFSWRRFENGKLGEIVSAPDDMPYFDTDWRFTAKGYKYFALCPSQTDCGLVKTNESTKPILIRKGNYVASDITVSPDGNWLVAAKKDQQSSWENLVRINLQTNEEFRINLELSVDFDILAYISAHNKFLIRQRKWMGYQKEPSFDSFLLNAKTGELEKADGDFQPLLTQNQDRKPLQPTQNPNVFWAAKHDYKGTTQFGLYDTKSFTFQPLATWSEIEFDSNNMWVDEKEMKIYFVYGGHLLSLPLPNISSV